MEHIERSHPLGVTLGEVVVDGYHMHTISREGVEEHRQCGDECLTLTGSHLGNLALMQNDTAEELHVVVDHLPLKVVATGSPVVVVNGLVAVDGDKVLAWVGSQVAVEFCGSNHSLFVGGKTLGCLLDDGKHLGHHLVELILEDVKDFLFNLVDLCKDIGTLVDGRILDFCLQVVNLLALCSDRFLYVLSYLQCSCTESVIVEILDVRRH